MEYSISQLWSATIISTIKVSQSMITHLHWNNENSPSRHSRARILHALYLHQSKEKKAFQIWTKWYVVEACVDNINHFVTNWKDVEPFQKVVGSDGDDYFNDAGLSDTTKKRKTLYTDDHDCFHHQKSLFGKERNTLRRQMEQEPDSVCYQKAESFLKWNNILS